MRGSPRSASRSSLACRSCRGQHLKCDAVRPICTRCETLSKPCSYPEPRRGPRSKSAAAQRSQCQTVLAAANPLTTATPSDTDFAPDLQLDGVALPISVPDTLVPMQLTPTLPKLRLQDILLDLYYQNFHPSHPFVLPQAALEARLQDRSSPSLRRLASVMRYIGSFYKESVPVNREYQDPEDGQTVDGFITQATLLQALAKSMCDDSTGASELLTLAIAQAMSIGMDKRHFANDVAALDPIMAESWRRTWWMIHVADTNFAIIRWDFYRFLADHSPEVDLPCDGLRYSRLDIPARSPSFEEYQNREYALLEQTYSSFAYYIEASTIYLESLQASTLYTSTTQDENVCSDWEATIVSWFLMLPSHMREVHSKSTVSDELIFQAHMMMHTALAFIHRPLSSLQYDPAEERSSCRPPPPPLCKRATPVDLSRLEMHSEKLLGAIRKQSQHLVLLPARSVQLSPFTICTVACCTIVHLVACKVAFNAEEARAARSRIRITLSTLKHYEDIWPRAKRLIRDLKLIANDLLQATATVAVPPVILNVSVPILEDDAFTSILGKAWNHELGK